MDASIAAGTQFLARPEGRIAYTVEGSGPLVVAVPGMGDLVSTWREQVAALVAAGYRVVLMDLPGHGASDTTFARYEDVAVGEHLVALLERLGERAVVMGNSMSGSAAIWAAATRPDLVAGLALTSPFGRDTSSPRGRRFARILFRVLLSGPWAVPTWTALYRTSFAKGRQPAWFGEHLAAIRTNLREPGRMRALRTLALQLDHDVIAPLVDRVTAPALVAIGENDPDFPDPAAEVAWLRDHLHADAHLVPGVAHYCHFQAPEVVTPLILSFVESLRDGDAWTTDVRGTRA